MWRVLPEEARGIPLKDVAVMDFLENYPDPNSTFVITEARQDSEIYARFFDHPGKCRLIFGDGEGRKSVISVLNLDSQKNPYKQRTVGIIDRDYDYANPKNDYPDGLIVTPTHDLETLILSSPAFNLIIDEFGDEDKIKQLFREKNQIVNVVLNAARPLGLLRLYNFQQFQIFIKSNPAGKRGLSFRNLDFRKFFNTDTLETETDNLIKCVIKNSKCSEISWCNSINIKEGIKDLETKFRDDWVVCQGHDIITILSIGLKYNFGIQGKMCSPGTIQAKLKNSSIYRKEFIIGNPFHQELILWEKTHVPFRLLANSLR